MLSFPHCPVSYPKRLPISLWLMIKEESMCHQFFLPFIMWGRTRVQDFKCHLDHFKCSNEHEHFCLTIQENDWDNLSWYPEFVTSLSEADRAYTSTTSHQSLTTVASLKSPGLQGFSQGIHTICSVQTIFNLLMDVGLPVAIVHTRKWTIPEQHESITK